MFMLYMENSCHSKPMGSRRKPSFSSSLLDHICRSIDHQPPAEAAVFKEDPYKIGTKTDQNTDIIMKPTSKLYGRKKSASADYHFPQSLLLNSCTSTSSDSSLWTSSDSDTSKSKTAAQTSFCSSHREHQQEDKKFYALQRKLKTECGGFVKAKSKTLKVCDNLKKSKAKQPISPGSRLAAFLNSLFFTSTGNDKKAKIIETDYKSSDIEPSAFSSASSFSRSCLSKTSSSQGKSSQGAKRSVRFYPVISVIMDEECQPDKHIGNEHSRYKNIRARNSICGEEIRENNRRARELLKNYQKRIEECKIMDDIDNEDCESCASSDLFELDIIGSKQRYCEELPVYETTSIDANRAIANGLLV